MANTCEYNMMVKGKKKDVDTLVKWLNAGYDYFIDDNGVPTLVCDSDHHFYRVLSAQSGEIDGEDEDVIRQTVHGDCAWSVATSMLKGRESIYHMPNDKFEDIRKDVNLVDASWLLDLEIEVYSKEPGMCFAEHYLINGGKMIIKESTEFILFCLEDYKTKEEAEKDLDLTITDKEWANRNKNDGWVERCDYNFKFCI